MRITEKQKITDGLKSRFIKTTAVILTDYNGLNVELLNSLRRKLRRVGVEFQVAKNSLLIRASRGNSVELIKDEFRGPSAVALCYADPATAAKILSDFAVDNIALAIKAGVLGNRAITVDEIKSLASLPSKEILLGQLLFSMSVSTSLVTLLSGIPREFVNVLQALKRKKED